MLRGARDSATGGQVTELQLFLADYFNLNEEDVATGFFGRLTHSYVVKFQQEKGLPSFGRVGSLTRAKIAEVCGNGQTGTTTTGGTAPTTGGTSGTGTTGTPSTTVGTGGTDSNGLTYSLTLKGGAVGSSGVSFVEGAEIGPFILTVKNNASVTKSVTFPNNCWYTYLISDKTNGGRTIFDLSTIQRCVSSESAVAKTFALKPGDSFFIDITHKIQTAHIPPGEYGMGILLNTRSGTDTVAKLEFKVVPRDSSSNLSCYITTNKSSYVLGETISVSWASTGATFANWFSDTQKDNLFLGGDKLAASGSATLTANVLGNPYVLMRVTNASGQTAICKLVIPVTSTITTPGSDGVKCGVNSYRVEGQCSEGSYQNMYARCQDGFQVEQGGITSCKPASVWSEYAATACANRCTLPSNTIKVTAPNGGEQWEIGQLNTVTWSPYSYEPLINTAQDVIVELLKKTTYCSTNAKCSEFSVVGKVMDTGKASLHTYFNLNDYSTWAEPGQYYIRARNDKVGALDVSDAPFTLLPRAIDIKVNGSDGPVTLTDNQPVSVTFKVGTVFSSCTLHGVRSMVNGATGISLTNTGLTTAFNGYAWAQVPGSSTAIYITCTKLDGTTRGDSVGVTMIGSATSLASLQVASPNGGEVIPTGQPYSVTWSQIGIKSASIALYKNDQWMKWLATDYVSDDGRQLFTWTPSGVEAEAAPLGQVFKIYITGLKRDGNGYVDDKSDAPFSFVGSTPAQTNPVVINSFTSSATSVASGQPITLTWSSNLSATDVSYYGGFCLISLLTDANQQIHLSGGTLGSPSGSVTHTPPMSGTYTIRCSSGGKDGSPMTEKTVRVTVGSTASSGELYAVGVYEATGAQHNFCYSKPGTVNVNLVQLIGTPKGAPITLSLSAYEPVIWNINVPTGVNLQKVILSGYNVQSPVITGASPLVERYFYSDPANASPGSSGQGSFYDDRDGADSRYQTVYHWAGQATCAATSGAVPVANRWYHNPGSNYFYAYQKTDSNYSTLVSKLQSITGLALKNFQGAYSGSSFTVTVGTPEY
jgi:hypothetical protein